MCGTLQNQVLNIHLIPVAKSTLVGQDRIHVQDGSNKIAISH